MNKGYIVKGIGGFYTVVSETGERITCRARGQLRNEHVKPVVGDVVLYDTFEHGDGTIEEILPRTNYIQRPMCANVTQGLLVCSVKKPDISYNLLDKMLIDNKKNSLKSIIVLTKRDIATEEEVEYIARHYADCCDAMICTSVITREGIEDIHKILQGNISVVRGVSGAGKSSLIKLLCPNFSLEVGELSKKISRGKNTTRHTELTVCGNGSYILDTPGFSSFELEGIACDELWQYYPEFYEHSDCRFKNCMHISEPDCEVKNAVESRQISGLRYNNYVSLYSELSKKQMFDNK